MVRSIAAAATLPLLVAWLLPAAVNANDLLRCRGEIADVVGTEHRDQLDSSDFQSGDVIQLLDGRDSVLIGEGRRDVTVCGGYGGDDIQVDGEAGPGMRLLGGPGMDLLRGTSKLGRHLVEHPLQIAGGSGDDYLGGGRGDDVVRGGGGRDFIGTAAGRDRIHGGAGNDPVEGGPGDDFMWGGGGRDDLYGYYRGYLANYDDDVDTARGGPGRDHCAVDIKRGCEQRNG